MAYFLVYSTASSRQEARKLATLLLQKKLVACVNILSQVESHYRWKGKQQNVREVLLMMKTKDELFDKIVRLIHQHHSYSVPEIIATPIQKGSPKYMKWLSEELGL